MPVTLETSIDGVIQTHAGEPDDNQFLQLVVSTILAEDEPAKLLLPMIRGYLLGRRRAIVRAVEQAAFREAAPGDGATRVKVTGAEAIASMSHVMAARLRPLLSEVIYVPGQGKVTWGQATVEQLQARAAMYAEQRAALAGAIADVETAIRAIQECPGATCLNDVYNS